MRQLARDPELNELLAFCTAVDLGSLGRAARTLHISQPALSKRLQVLEGIAGVQLLQRSHSGVTPTPHGQRLYLAARRVLAENQGVVELLSAMVGEHTPARLAVSPTMAESVVPTLLVEFEHQHTHHLSVELTIVVSSTVWRLVSDGYADIGIAAATGSADYADLRQFTICEDDVVVLVPAHHRWAEMQEIPIDEFTATPMIMREPGADSRQVVEQVLEDHGLQLAPAVAEIGSNAAAKIAASAEGLPALLSRLTVSPGDEGTLVARHVEGLSFSREFVLGYGPEEHLSPVARALLEHIRRRVDGGWKPRL
jgi:DNA-binding transcriptional LysR family regulator